MAGPKEWRRRRALDRIERASVWIWGSPRSGSSWLLAQLCDPLEPDVRRRSGFRVIQGARARADGAIDAIPIDEPFIANHLAPALADPIERGDGSYEAATPNRHLAREPGYAFSARHIASWVPAFRELALLRLQAHVEQGLSDALDLADPPRLAIKEGSGSHASDLVMSVFSQSRMVFLTRDGRDVVDSLLHAYEPGGFLAKNQGWAISSPAQRSDALAWACRLWACNVDVTLRAHDAHDPERRTIVRYEDLLADPQAGMRSLFDWLELERTETRIAELVAAHDFGAVPATRRGAKTRQRAASPGLWRENLSPAEQVKARDILGPRLERLGYED